MQHDMKTIVVGSSHKRKGGIGQESQCRSWPIMSSIEGKPISASNLGLKSLNFSRNAATSSMMRYQEEQIMMKTLKSSTKGFCHGWPLKART